MTVETFGDFLARWELDNGQLPKLLNWWKKDNQYVSTWVLPPAKEPLYIQFTHLLSKRQGGGSLSRFTTIEGGARVFGSDDIGTAVRSMFIRELRSDVELLAVCKRSSEARPKWLGDGLGLFKLNNTIPSVCWDYKPKCVQDQSAQCVEWRAVCDRDALCFGLDRGCDACENFVDCLSKRTFMDETVFQCTVYVSRACNQFPNKCDEIVQKTCKQYPDVCGRRAG